MELSVIIPVYNVELYLDKCIQSMLGRNDLTFEIILIDDGSLDSCPQICDLYAEKDSRVVVVHKSNGGLSDARNTGMKIARGKYILFVDADDWIVMDNIKEIVGLAEKFQCDIVTGEANKVIGKTSSKIKNFDTKGKLLSGKEYLKNQLKYNCYPIVAWINLYRKTFLIKNNLFFQKGIYHEDEEWTPRVFLKANRIVSSNCCFYNYVIRYNSITMQVKKEKNALDKLATCQKLLMLSNTLEDIKLKKLLYNHLCRIHRSAFIDNAQYYIEHPAEIDRKFILRYGTGIKEKGLGIVFFVSLRLFKMADDVKKLIISYLRK